MIALRTLSSRPKVDFPTIKIFLKSPLALQPLADEMNLDYSFLERVIIIKDERETRTKGNIINVSIKLRDYKLGKKLISNLSNTYMQLAVDMRRKRLNDGLEQVLNTIFPIELNENSR